MAMSGWWYAYMIVTIPVGVLAVVALVAAYLTNRGEPDDSDKQLPAE